MENDCGRGLSRERPPDTIDVKRDPKDTAIQTIQEFIGVTSDFILAGHALPSIPHTELARTGAERLRTYTPNQLLARSMYGLHGALTMLRQLDPPYEAGETLTSDWDIVDGSSGLVTTKRFTAAKTGSDFGTFLSCQLNHDPNTALSGGNILHVTIPSDLYLSETVQWGNPHEPVFYACEPDVYSDEWSDEQKSYLPNGGVAERTFDEARAWFDDEGKFVTGKYRKDVYRRAEVFYRPLYNPNASGIQRYVEITQEMLRMFLLSYDENRIS